MESKLSLQRWIDEAARQSMSFGDYCLKAQAEELEIPAGAILDRMEKALEVMAEAVKHGLEGKRSRSGLAGGAGSKMQALMEVKPDGFILGRTMSRAVMTALAASESNACMGRIVAAPTAGSSGVLPGVLFSVGDLYCFDRRHLTKGLVVAGCIGRVIASRASLSGAEGGCQAECGSAAAMAAGATVEICGGTPGQVGDAAAIALKNMLGLVCDPVAGLVEVPCVKRNAGAAAQALVAAEMALCGISSAIPVDEVIDAMASIGHSIPQTLKETALGGLATTPTGLRIAGNNSRSYHSCPKKE
ncbi:L-serine ammonia-lyase, iron-sulfur-dependent, subunit alpha [Methanocella sp. MCL-LM]|uniref:L-serine ammonia-lyase, iron-sulfur-dependent, subunit alpha n=1 Tax=Methanocella sp. MCL-LM TaxID=3412035 RepID=UPI003C73B78B